MGIQIKTVRIYGFRGLKNVEVELEPITVLTGMNNSGKTSFLKALQIVFGNKQFITQEDFFISGDSVANQIIIDVKIIPVDNEGKQSQIFDEEWEILFTEDRIITDDNGNQFIPIRTTIEFDTIKNTYKTKQFVKKEWGNFVSDDDTKWYQSDNGSEKSFYFDEIPFFYVNAQRDILEDMRIRNSYLGKMISKIEYSEADIQEIEDQIKLLNDKAVQSSDILSNIKTTLKELNSALETSAEGIEITPFTKKVRDLNKGLTIYYSDRNESFSMEYHGMGTRSWSSLLTLKAFISLLEKNSERESEPFFPVLALEEPEAHLHPNAQKKLYQQLNQIKGQKIISTHSPYVAASAGLEQIRNFYKDNEDVFCEKIDVNGLSTEDLRKIDRMVLNTRGEIFFSKAVVFFEGETEEQALPIFAEKYFSISPGELGIDFIGTGGAGNYLPFLRVVESLKIPWFILSDAEENIKKNLKKHFESLGSPKSEEDVIVFLDEGNTFEKQLIGDGYQDEIKQVIKKIKCPEYLPEQFREIKGKEIDEYNNTEILKIIVACKTQFGPEVAYAIISSGKDLPPKVVGLFKKMNNALNILKE